MRGSRGVEQDALCRLPLNTPATDVDCGDSRSSPERVSHFLGAVSLRLGVRRREDERGDVLDLLVAQLALERGHRRRRRPRPGARPRRAEASAGRGSARPCRSRPRPSACGSRRSPREAKTALPAVASPWARSRRRWSCVVVGVVCSSRVGRSSLARGRRLLLLLAEDEHGGDHRDEEEDAERDVPADVACPGSSGCARGSTNDETSAKRMKAPPTTASPILLPVESPATTSDRREHRWPEPIGTSESRRVAGARLVDAGLGRPDRGRAARGAGRAARRATAAITAPANGPTYQTQKCVQWLPTSCGPNARAGFIAPPVRP